MSTRRRAVVGSIALAFATAGCGGGDDTKTVTAVDYRFETLPSSVKAGTALRLVNKSTTELHEMVVMRIPDEERRSIDELAKLPESEFETVFGGKPALVILRAPGGEQVNALGDGKLTEKGRYAVICAIPTGADPAAYLANTSDGPPQVAGGPPHFIHGMYGQITVK
ncbi:MAG: hypothetical protein M3450_06755 [Actinomycetota bacterium]|nr:hypothetical protein [Actinomycetota bacterium]